MSLPQSPALMYSRRIPGTIDSASRPDTSYYGGNPYALYFGYDRYFGDVTVELKDFSFDTVTVEAMLYRTGNASVFLVRTRVLSVNVKFDGRVIIAARTGRGVKESFARCFISIPARQWIHLAVVIDADRTAFFYLDGELKGECVLSDESDELDPPQSVEDLDIGIRYSTEVDLGFIADVRIWKKPLGEQEVRRYNLRHGMPFRTHSLIDRRDPDLVGWWPLDEGCGRRVMDKSANGFHSDASDYLVWIKRSEHPHRDFASFSHRADFKRMIGNPMSSDVKICIAPDPGDAGVPETGEFLHAHKIILASRCQFFEAMFTAQMKESHTSEIYLSDISMPTLKKMLEFIYAGDTGIDGDCAIELLVASEKYGLPDLKSTCEAFLIPLLELDTVCHAFVAAIHARAKWLKRACFVYIVHNLDRVSQKEEYKMLLPAKTIEKIRIVTLPRPYMSVGSPAKRQKLADVVDEVDTRE